LAKPLRVADPRAGCAGTPPRPGWFFLDKIFGGRKFLIVKREKYEPDLARTGGDIADKMKFQLL
jgi:hypothetical protein